MKPDPALIASQLEDYWADRLDPGLATMTTADYLWEPVQGCWSLRNTGGSIYTVDFAHPAPVPPPVTTIAWRTAFIVTNLLTRAHHHFNEPAFSPGTMSWPPTIELARALLTETIGTWLTHLKALSQNDLARRAGLAEGKHHAHSIGEMLLNANCQVIHHGGAILLQRDIHRSVIRQS